MTFLSDGGPARISFLIFCLFSAIVVGLAFAMAMVSPGSSVALSEIWNVCLHYRWVRGALVDFVMISTLFSIWIFYREQHLGRALVAIILLWLCGTAFFGLYIAALWWRSRGSVEKLLLGNRGAMTTE